MTDNIEVRLSEARILVCDIETSPILAYVWGLFDQNIGLNQIVEDWSVLSWAAKWLGEDEIFYQDVRAATNKRDDKEILQLIWKLLDEADVVIWHYGKQFDKKKLNARFILNSMTPVSPYREIDTKEISSQTFKFTSNKLEYLADKLNVHFKKLKHSKFPGQEMWNECLKNNHEAFDEMEIYNKHDILATEELYHKLQAWQKNPIDFNVFRVDSITNKCNCGSANLTRQGWRTTNSGRFQRYRCEVCGAWSQDSGSANNALSKEKRSGLKRRVT